MIIEIELDQNTITHEKSMYTYFDLLGDVGGLLDLLLIIFTLFM